MIKYHGKQIKDMNTLEFKKITMDDLEALAPFSSQDEHSCENTFVNLLVWQSAYANEFALHNGQIFVRSSWDGEYIFRLPVGGDLRQGVKVLYDYCGGYPVFWSPDGPLFKNFQALYGDKYTFVEECDDFDYIYSREALAQLSGKKYHSKRNHISAFSKKYDWHYEPINEDNINDVRECAARWYKENNDRMGEAMKHEAVGVETILSNMRRLGVKGGALRVNGEIIAFTLGSPVNSSTFDVYIEKALSEYNGAYAVINREFVRNELGEYLCVNREDDMGLEGLRRSKRSYYPEYLLKKYIIQPKVDADE